MTKGIIVSPANRGVQVVVTDENNVQLLIDSNRGVNLSVVPQPRIEVLVDKGVEGAQGPQGPQGTAATVTAGTTTTGAAGTNAIVTNSGTSSAAVFDFTIPRGNTGATGATGAGVAIGGTTGQVLVKASNVNYDTAWATITGTLVYQGSWNASTNTPTLTSSVGTNGYYYVVGTSGSTNLNGITDWVVGDWAIFNGSIWQKIDNTDLVSSVNGQTGVVVLGASDVGAVPTSRTISAGTGLFGGGDLSANRTLAIANSGVSSATYGSSTTVPVIAVNAQGQITSATNVAITGTGTPAAGYYGAFSDFTNQTAASTTTAYLMTFNTTDASGGVTIVSGSRITFLQAATYNIQWSGQFVNSATQDEDVNVWVRINGVNVTGSTGKISIPAKHGGVNGHTIASWNYVFTLNTNDYVEFVWNTTSTSVSIETFASGTSPTRPSTASLILTAQQITNTIPSAPTGAAGGALSGTYPNPSLAPINNTSIGATTPSTGRFSDLTDTGLTSGRVIYASTGGNLVDASNFTYDGTNLVAGAIQNTPIGATTPATGTFTTLTSTSTATLGGDATNPSLVAAAVSGSTRWLQISGSSAGNVTLAVQGTGTPNLILQNRSTGSINFATNNSASNVQLVASHTASAVNYVQVTGAATGANVTISTQGSDASVFGTLLAKGNGGWDITGNGASTFRNSAGANQFQVTPTTSAVNYLRATGGATGNGVQFSAQGSDTNISQVFQSKGTGAIDLAAGSSGVNISNGGTVTAITRTAAGSLYTGIPSVAITAPTTAGGVQSTATAIVQIRQTSGVTINSGGTGYTVGDTLTVVGGTGTAAQFTVATVSSGVITTITLAIGGAYSALPTFPASVTGGTGSSATFTFTDMSLSATPVTITNAGSGYVEQPTVSFSGGGGSGAAAYATVGSGTVVKSIGSTLDIATPTFITSSIPVARFRDVGGADTFTQFQPNSGYAQVIAQGNSNGNLFLAANGTGRVSVQTNGTSQTEQFRIAHTASAVNYVQVTGGATTVAPTISSQGSDSSIGLIFQSKTASILFVTRSGQARSFNILDSASPVNYIQVQGNTATNAPILSAQGSDTDIDITFTPKNAGNVRFGTYTAGVLTPTGYITIKDSGGTVRRLLVG